MLHPLYPLSMKFMLNDGRILEIDEDGFMVLQDDKIILEYHTSEYEDVQSIIQISDLKRFKIFKDKKKEFATYQFKED